MNLVTFCIKKKKLPYNIVQNMEEKYEFKNEL